MDDRYEQLKAELLPNPAVDELVDGVVRDLRKSVREAEPLRSRVKRQEAGAEADLSGHVEGCLRAASKAVVSLATGSESSREVLNGFELLTELTAGEASELVLLWAWARDEMSEENILELLREIRSATETWPKRMARLSLDSRNESKKTRSGKDQQEWMEYHKLVKSAGRVAAHTWWNEKYGEAVPVGAGIGKPRVIPDRLDGSVNEVSLQELIRAARVLLACDDETLDSVLGGARTHLSKEPGIEEWKLDLIHLVEELGFGLRQQLEDLVLGFGLILTCRLKLNRAS